MARCVDTVRVTGPEQSWNAMGFANASAKAAALRAKVTPPPQVVPMRPSVISSRNWPRPPKGLTAGERRPLGDLHRSGGTTGKSERFRTRVGDLLADLFGFYTTTTGHHSVGDTS